MFYPHRFVFVFFRWSLRNDRYVQYFLGCFFGRGFLSNKNDMQKLEPDFSPCFFFNATSKAFGFSTCKSGDTAGPEEWRKALEEVETRMAIEGPQGSAGNTNSDQSAEKNLFPKGAIRGIQPEKDLKFRFRNLNGI